MAGFGAGVRDFGGLFGSDRPSRQVFHERREVGGGRFHQDHLRRGFIQNFRAPDRTDFLNMPGRGRALAGVPEHVAAARWTGYRSIPWPSKRGPKPKGRAAAKRAFAIASDRRAFRFIPRIKASLERIRAAAPVAAGQAIDVPLIGA